MFVTASLAHTNAHEEGKNVTIEVDITDSHLLEMADKLNAMLNSDLVIKHTKKKKLLADSVRSPYLDAGMVLIEASDLTGNDLVVCSVDDRLRLYDIASLNVKAVSSGKYTPGTLIMIDARSMIGSLEKACEDSPGSRYYLSSLSQQISEMSLSSNGNIAAAIVRIADASKCARCGLVVDNKNLKIHERGWECNITAGKNAAEAAGYIEVTPSEVYEVIKATNIDIRLVPTRYTVYAPAWVKTMVENFRHNEIDGMTLSELLNKAADGSGDA